MEQNVTLRIDKHTVRVPAGTTVLDAARSVGIDIPTLCHIDLKELCIRSAPASCRVCVVEIEGFKKLMPACVTKCTEGMTVRN